MRRAVAASMLVLALLTIACADEDLEGIEASPTAMASPAATAPISTPRATGTPTMTAASIDDQVAEALFAGETIPVLVHGHAPVSIDCRELLPDMVAPSELLDVEVRRQECATDPVWAFSLRFSGSLDDALRLRGVQVLVLMDEDRRPWDGTADPGGAPLVGVVETEVLARGHDDCDARTTWAPLPERAQGVAFTSDVHCWELRRFSGDTEEEPAPLLVRCILD